MVFFCKLAWSPTKNTKDFRHKAAKAFYSVSFWFSFVAHAQKQKKYYAKASNHQIHQRFRHLSLCT